MLKNFELDYNLMNVDGEVVENLRWVCQAESFAHADEQLRDEHPTAANVRLNVDPYLYTILIGSPLVGFTHYGLFLDQEAFKKKFRKDRSLDELWNGWWIVPVYFPEALEEIEG